MKKLIILAALALTACETTQTPDIGQAPPPKMPELPAGLAKPATALPLIDDATLAGINRSGVETDIAYNALAFRYNALINAWECVRKALDAKSEETAKKCFSEVRSR